MENREAKNDVRFDLLENGFDFILSGLRHISKTESKSDLKYAILHLCAGAELILKERLRREHWTLLFEDTDKANTRDFESDNFTSVSFRASIKRLKGICNVSLSEQHERRLNNLRNRRNQLEHFGIIDSAEALTSSAAHVLSILLEFIAEHLSPDQFSEAESVLLRELRGKLGEFEALVQRRLREVLASLADLAEEGKQRYVLICPVCYQSAFVLGDTPSCLFCGHSTGPELAVHEWIERILAQDYATLLKDGGTYPLWSCPECDRETLVDIGPSGSQFEVDQYICFACGEAWKESWMKKCMICGRPYPAEEDDVRICPDCLRDELSKK